MSLVSRNLPWLGCVVCCALAGCCLTQKSRTACCTQSAACVVSEIPSTYENYTPPPQPTLSPLPVPAPPVESVLPSPATRVAPDNSFDFFDSAKANRSPQVTR